MLFYYYKLYNNQNNKFIVKIKKKLIKLKKNLKQFILL